VETSTHAQSTRKMQKLAVSEINLISFTSLTNRIHEDLVAGDTGHDCIDDSCSSGRVSVRRWTCSWNSSHSGTYFRWSAAGGSSVALWNLALLGLPLLEPIPSLPSSSFRVKVWLLLVVLQGIHFNFKKMMLFIHWAGAYGLRSALDPNVGAADLALRAKVERNGWQENDCSLWLVVDVFSIFGWMWWLAAETRSNKVLATSFMMELVVWFKFCSFLAT